jgi:hypothetical protein
MSFRIEGRLLLLCLCLDRAFFIFGHELAQPAYPAFLLSKDRYFPVS